MKKLLLVFSALCATLAVFGQPTVRNTSPDKWVEVSTGNNQMIIAPQSEKAVWFLPTSGQVEIRLRYFVGEKVKSNFLYTANIVADKNLVLPETEPTKLSVPVSNTDNNASKLSAVPGSTIQIPMVSGSVIPEIFPLTLVDSTKSTILVFDGAFYGAALAPGQQTSPIQTKPGMISFKILYDADPQLNSSGKNIWQTPVSGIVTQGQKSFILRQAHLNNIQRNVTKVVFFNTTGSTMVCDNAELNIEPISPNRRSRPVRLNQGFNNISFSYINSQGVKVRAVYELVVSRGTPVISLNLNPLGNAYGIIK